MYLAKYGLLVPKLWYHKPDFENRDGETVASYYINAGIVPPREWVVCYPYITIRHYKPQNNIRP